MPRDFYVQPDAPDPILPADVVLALACRHVPEARAVTGVDESGGEARTYAIDDAYILKTQRPQQLRPRTSLEKEVCFLTQLATAAPEISVPRVLGYGREGSAIEYTVMTRMAGVPMRHAHLDAAARRDAVARLGTVLRRIHTLPQAPFVASGLFPGDHTFVDVQIRLGTQFGEMAQKIRDEGRPWQLPLTPEQVGARALAALPRTEARVALHSNPYLEHVFVHPDTGRYSGLIDFGDAFISHPTLDMRRWNQPADRDALLRGYASEQPLSDGFLATWRTMMVLADLIAIAHYPERAATAAADLDHLLAEL